MAAISPADLRLLLDQKHDQFNAPDFIREDPISIPHQFSQKEDIEIAGFLSALIAWGRRSMIIQNARKLVQIMDMAPFEFVMKASGEELSRLDDFVHRTFNGIDAKALVLALRHVYADHDGLESIFAKGIQPEDDTVINAILHARKCLTSVPDFPDRSHKHLANPAKGSSAKRINMFLRWMVRQDNRGVDFGLWKSIDPALLICPLDVHTGNVGRKLGLLQRKQNDWKAAAELTASLRTYCPEDPVRYDFSLFGLGIYEGF
ncbi:MAG: TIGR02757 family protein [Bacteroidota bacterium]